LDRKSLPSVLVSFPRPPPDLSCGRLCVNASICVEKWLVRANPHYGLDVDRYSDLSLFASGLERSICKDCVAWSTPIVQSAIELGFDERVCFQLTCSATMIGNLLLSIATTVGEVHLFVGTVPHPTPLVSRWQSAGPASQKNLTIFGSESGQGAIYITLYGVAAINRSVAWPTNLLLLECAPF
jgi:hypothetical protein